MSSTRLGGEFKGTTTTTTTATTATTYVVVQEGDTNDAQRKRRQPQRRRRLEGEKSTALMERARSRWLQAQSAHELQRVEQLYRSIYDYNDENHRWSTTTKRQRWRQEDGKEDQRDDNDDKNKHHENPIEEEDDDEDDDNDSTARQDAGEKISLLLLQSGRSQEANQILHDLNYTCRLATHVLNYPTTRTTTSSISASYSSTCGTGGGGDPPCRVFDNFLTSAELAILQSVFTNPYSSYWTDHDYTVEPKPSPYFSYVIPLQASPTTTRTTITTMSEEKDEEDTTIREFGFLACLIRRILYQLSKASSSADDDDTTAPPWKPQLLQQCTHVELWAHNRPAVTGHQLHFDSDNEGDSRSSSNDENNNKNNNNNKKSDEPPKVRHPLVSTVLYLSSSSSSSLFHSKDDSINRGGGPTLITNQRRMSRHLADQGWLCAPKLGRLVAFDGRVLHGVIPGKLDMGNNNSNNNEDKGTHNIGNNNNRVTLMLAFWRRLQVRDHGSSKVGAAKAFPTTTTWAKVLRQPFRPQQPTVMSLVSSSSSSSRLSTITIPSTTTTTHSTDHHKNKDNDDNDNEDTNVLIHLPHVYETVQDGKPWTRAMGMPCYDEIYQGF